MGATKLPGRVWFKTACCAFAIIVLFGGSSFADIAPAAKFLKVSQLAHIRVGDSIDSLASITREEARFKLHHEIARFHVYYFNPSLPIRCLNLECGTFAIPILSHGGFLLGGADARYLREADGSAHEPVALVTDRHGRVEAIYRGVSRAALPRAVSEVELR